MVSFITLAIHASFLCSMQSGMASRTKEIMLQETISAADFETVSGDGRMADTTYLRGGHDEFMEQWRKTMAQANRLTSNGSSVAELSATAESEVPASGAGSGEAISFPQFQKMAEAVNWDLQHEGALKRVFSYVSNGRSAASEADFVAACATSPHREFLRELLKVAFAKYVHCNEPCSAGKPQGICLTICGQVGPEYDWTTYTNTNYQWKDAGNKPTFTAPYAKFRQATNASYHGYYSMFRQRWQDAWISRIVSRAPSHVKQPWLIYTAGGMGVGKGHAMSWLARMGFVALENVVYVDPDYFKKAMPEYAEYKALGKEEGTMTHRESGYLQELAFEAALDRQSHIVIDGSLRDKNWFVGTDKHLGEIPTIKSRFSMYKVAVIHIDLDLDFLMKTSVIQQRLAQRAATERQTPIDKAMASFPASAETVELLVTKGIADFAVHIDNAKKTPRVIRFGRNGGWQDPPAKGSAFDIVGQLLGPEALSQRQTADYTPSEKELASLQRMANSTWSAFSG